MKIVADENIPFVAEAFGPLGETVILPSSSIEPSTVRDVDILLVRSVTKVDRRLLEGSSVTFVGTATIGIDHIDTEYLSDRGIGFASAPGSNATSVAEYVMCALLCLAGRKGFRLEGMTIGVVGVGNVGSRVVRMAEGLGMIVLQNDPPLKRKTGESRFIPLDDLMGADIVTLHVPLTREGQDATWHFFDGERISRMKSGSLLINTSRGPVVAGEALQAALDAGHLSAAALDVWENEPDIDVHLLETVDLGTSHIAGYSLDGKVRGMAMIYEAVCDFLNIEPDWNLERAMPKPVAPFMEMNTSIAEDEETLNDMVRHIYDIQRDDRALRDVLGVPAGERGNLFRTLRKTYPVRREFHNTILKSFIGRDALKEKSSALGFRLEE